MAERLLNWIAGESLKNKNDETFDNFNPATGELISKVEMALESEVNQAVLSAEKAQKMWAEQTGTQRGRILHKTAQLLREHKKELALIEVKDTGKPIKEALEVDIDSAADALEYFAGVAPTIKGEHHQLGKNFAYTRREPLGVVAGIGAWNYPLQIACWKAAPALASGNAMIFKPSELTPTSAVKLAQIFKEAGLPDGLFNVVLGDERTGKTLVSHTGVKKISLTGEVSTGQKIMEAAAQSLKHVTFELGGKSPLVIYEDANIEAAVQGAIDANFYTQGEICSNGTRVFVHEKIMDEFLSQLKQRTQNLKMGDPVDEDTEVGSLISQEHRSRVLEFIESGKQQGAQLLCGGEAWGEQGAFLTPAIFTNCKDDMKIVTEEIFGPVMSVLSFKDEEEVIDRANNTPYGLAAGVYTSDLKKAHEFASKVEAGICWINSYNVTPIEIPFGGYKMSGLGRENSEWAIQHYTQVKTVYVDTTV